MQVWVRPLLRQLKPETVSDESFEWEFQQVPFVWRRVSQLFSHQFESEPMEELLGSVLCDLPSREVFDQLFAIYPFFILAKSPGFCQAFHGGQETIQVVIFSASDLRPMSWSAKRGCIAHELGHVVRGDVLRPFSLDDPYRHGIERATDDLCCEWGFTEEIASVRKYLSERRIENGTV
jgi:hypothetical protein